jgi:hypothetical protein
MQRNCGVKLIHALTLQVKAKISRTMKAPRTPAVNIQCGIIATTPD